MRRHAGELSQQPTSDYSSNASARASSLAGIAMPSARTVCMLTTTWNAVGCCTGFGWILALAHTAHIIPDHVVAPPRRQDRTHQPFRCREIPQRIMGARRDLTARHHQRIRFEVLELLRPPARGPTGLRRPPGAIGHRAASESRAGSGPPMWPATSSPLTREGLG